MCGSSDADDPCDVNANRQTTRNTPLDTTANDDDIPSIGRRGVCDRCRTDRATPPCSTRPDCCCLRSDRSNENGNERTNERTFVCMSNLFSKKTNNKQTIGILDAVATPPDAVSRKESNALFKRRCITSAVFACGDVHVERLRFDDRLTFFVDNADIAPTNDIGLTKKKKKKKNARCEQISLRMNIQP
jgi:hypothetical protein